MKCTDFSTCNNCPVLTAFPYRAFTWLVLPQGSVKHSEPPTTKNKDALIPAPVSLSQRRAPCPSTGKQWARPGLKCLELPLPLHLSGGASHLPPPPNDWETAERSS